MPVFNTGAVLREALESALAQTIPVDIVVVDDASTDATTLDILEEYASRPGIRLLRHAENVFPAGLNTGIAELATPYVFVLGSDDIVEPQYAAEAAKILDRDQHVAVVTTSLRRFGGSDEIYVPGGAPNGVVDLIFQNTIPGVSVCRRSDWEAVGGYRSLSWGEDWDFWIRVLSRGGRCVLLPEPLYRWRVHANQLTSKTSWQDKLSQQVEMVSANPDPWRTHIPIIMETVWRGHLQPTPTLREQNKRWIWGKLKTIILRFAR